MEHDYHDYPNRPIGGDNPYWCCKFCDRSDPEINGRLEGHMPWCKYRVFKEKYGHDVPFEDDPEEDGDY